MMTYAEAQEHFEKEAQRTHEELVKLPLETLLSRIKERRFDDYFQIWYAVAEKRDVRVSAPVLLSELHSNLVFHHRYHCAKALLSLLPYSGIREIDVSDRRRPTYEMYLAELEQAVAEAIGDVTEGLDGAV